MVFESQKKSKITTTFKREICRNLDKKVRLRQIFMNFLYLITCLR